MPQAIINQTRHYFRLEGSPVLPTVVLMHPIGADLGIWDRLVPLLTTRFQVLRYDIRGHGGSETVPGECTLDGLSDDLISLVDHLQLVNFSICGVSLGGMVAASAAIKSSSRIKSLILCSMPLALHGPPGGWNARAKTVLNEGMLPLASPMVTRMFSQQFRDTGDPCIDTVHNTFALSSPAGYASACAVLRDTNLTGQISAIKVPTLVITGTLDALVSADDGEQVTACIAGARHVRLSAGHFPQLEAPKHLAETIFEFVL